MTGLFAFWAPATIKDWRRKTPATYEIVTSMNEKNLWHLFFKILSCFTEDLIFWEIKAIWNNYSTMQILGFHHQVKGSSKRLSHVKESCSKNKHTPQNISKGRLLLVHFMYAFISYVAISIIKKINSYSSRFRTHCTNKPKERQTEVKKNGNFSSLLVMN